MSGGSLVKNPKITVRAVKVADLIPYAKNSRTHSEAQVAQIAASIKEFGFVNPVLIAPDKGIVAGHGRVLAARLLGLETVPAIELAHLTETQRRAYVIADNRLAELAGWDDALLALELQELRSAGFDIDVVGYSGDELDRLIAAAADAPSPNTGIDYEEKFAVLVECDNEPHQAKIYNDLVALGLACKVLVN